MKKAMSAIISSLLLIVMVVVMAGIIMFWSRGITGEVITIHGQNIELICHDILFESSYDSGILYIINSGNVDIYSLELVVHKEDSSGAVDIREISSNWPEDGLTQGGIFSDTIGFDAEVTEVSLLPVLRGDTDSGKQKEHICEYEGQIIEPN